MEHKDRKNLYHAGEPIITLFLQKNGLGTWSGQLPIGYQFTPYCPPISGRKSGPISMAIANIRSMA
ncbi:hypothetical protein [Albibacterium profundi]|uniref:Uncharacterized protein n=1 Tax=Albibacterium profundi TaxID=3134906 RepID=A0ABV5CEP9_9SPHI